jgi:hypothetical protein
MKRPRKFTPPRRPVVPMVRLIKTTTESGAADVVQEEVDWVVYACNTHATEHTYWMLVAPSARVWNAALSNRQGAILNLVADLTCEFGTVVRVDAQNRPTAYVEPCWIWVLRDPQDVFHLMSPDLGLRKVQWSAMPALDPAIPSGSRNALFWLFAQEAQAALSELGVLT